MIISHTDEVIFITTPKSGSHSGFKLMEKYFGVAINFNHNREIPSKYRNYFSFTFVRNPYERFCALYHACVINDSKAFVPAKAKKSILNYADWMYHMTLHHTYPREDLCAAQHYWHRKSRINKYIQIENAEEELKELFPDMQYLKIPHELKREHPTWKDVRTDELTYLVSEWAGKDFELYEYERENISW